MTVSARRLAELPVGGRARVVGIDPEVPRALALRLLEMGVLPGTEVALVRRAPLGDPLHLRLRGYSLSIRRAEAASITVEPLEATRP